MIVLFDLDGTLADCEHRRHHILTPGKRKDYDAFFKECPNDQPIWPVIAVFQAMQRDSLHHPMIWSGRSDAVEIETRLWLIKHGIRYDRIIPNAFRMRPAGDNTPDHELKERWLHEQPKRFWPDIVFDDRNRVVDMWRRNGIICAQVAPGNF